MDNLIETEGIFKSYDRRDRLILNDVSFTLHRRESVALTGPSGSGKTTLLSILAGLLPPDRGRLTYAFHERTPTRHLTSVLRQRLVGIVFQAYHLIPTLTVTENIEIPMLGLLKDNQRRIRRAGELVEALGLTRVAAQYPFQLSGGEKQRVAVGRAFANRPELVFADEPTGNLDTVSADRVMEALFQMTTDVGGALLTVTHNAEIAQRFDRTIRIVDGKLVT